jgi:hypothetical protein
MKGLGVFGLISLLLIAVLGLYSCTIMKEFKAVEREIQEDYQSVEIRLRAIEGKKKVAIGSAFRLNANSFDSWLAVRQPMAAALQEPFDQKHPATNIQLRRLRNRVLNQLADALPAQDLGFAEYCAISTRWQALLARPEFSNLQEAWNKRVRVESDPNPLPLPPPAMDATKLELQLITTNAVHLAASLEADKMTRLLVAILD